MHWFWWIVLVVGGLWLIIRLIEFYGIDMKGDARKFWAVIGICALWLFAAIGFFTMIYWLGGAMGWREYE